MGKLMIKVFDTTQDDVSTTIKSFELYCITVETAPVQLYDTNSIFEHFFLVSSNHEIKLYDQETFFSKGSLLGLLNVILQTVKCCMKLLSCFLLYFLT